MHRASSLSSSLFRRGTCTSHGFQSHSVARITSVRAKQGTPQYVVRATRARYVVTTVKAILLHTMGKCPTWKAYLNPRTFHAAHDRSRIPTSNVALYSEPRYSISTMIKSQMWQSHLVGSCEGKILALGPYDKTIQNNTAPKHFYHRLYYCSRSYLRVA